MGATPGGQIDTGGSERLLHMHCDQVVWGDSPRPPSLTCVNYHRAKKENNANNSKQGHTTCPIFLSFSTLHQLEASMSGQAATVQYVVRPPGKQPFLVIICCGPITEFAYPANPSSSAIVNASNPRCLVGGGVDGAISTAGGPTLLYDRQILPFRIMSGKEVRCLPGNAVITGPNNYGQLQVPYVIHAVGPN